jgi:hypothetical protein
MFHPIQRTSNGAMPSVQFDLTVFRSHIWHKCPIHATVLGDILERIKATDRESGQIGCAERRGFDASWAENGQSENIGLELQ